MADGTQILQVNLNLTSLSLREHRAAGRMKGKNIGCILSTGPWREQVPATTIPGSGIHAHVHCAHHDPTPDSAAAQARAPRVSTDRWRFLLRHWLAGAGTGGAQRSPQLPRVACISQRLSEPLPGSHQHGLPDSPNKDQSTA